MCKFAWFLKSDCNYYVIVLGYSLISCVACCWDTRSGEDETSDAQSSNDTSLLSLIPLFKRTPIQRMSVQNSKNLTSKELHSSQNSEVQHTIEKEYNFGPADNMVYHYEPHHSFCCCQAFKISLLFGFLLPMFTLSVLYKI